MVEEKQKKKFSFLKLKKKSADTTKTAAVKEVKKGTASAAAAAKQAAASPPLSAPTAPVVPIVEGNPAADDTNPPPSTGGGSWLSRTSNFRKMSNWAFEVVDTDGSGCVDEKELYSGLLLIHLKLGSYAGPAACKPVGRERVHDIFLKRDLDHSGSLDKEEFNAVMSVLCGNIFTRVFVQWSLTLMIVPLVAQYMLNGVVWVVGTVWDFVSELDDIEAIEEVFSARAGQLSEWFCQFMPNVLLNGASKFGSTMQAGIDMVPDSVWSTVPVTMISCVLGCLVVPYTIFKVDDFFQAMADRNKPAAAVTTASKEKKES